jgi:hypothetical protein
MEEVLVDRKSVPREKPNPPPNPARIERDQTSRQHRNEQKSFPENEGLVMGDTREAGDVESPKGAEAEKERVAAAQRGRVN